MKETEREHASELIYASTVLHRVGLVVLAMLGLTGVVAAFSVMNASSGMAGLLLLIFVATVVWLTYLSLLVVTRVTTVQANISAIGIDNLQALKILSAQMERVSNEERTGWVRNATPNADVISGVSQKSTRNVTAQEPVPHSSVHSPPEGSGRQLYLLNLAEIEERIAQLDRLSECGLQNWPRFRV
jgi:hypothetical protein